MCCIAFVFYSKTFIYQNCGKTVLCHGESVFICTSASKHVSAVIYNSFLLLVIARLEKLLLTIMHWINGVNHQLQQPVSEFGTCVGLTTVELYILVSRL